MSPNTGTTKTVKKAAAKKVTKATAKKSPAKATAKKPPAKVKKAAVTAAATNDAQVTILVPQADIIRHKSLVDRAGAVEVEDLVASISKLGLTNPISVISTAGKIYRVAGERRLKAIRQIEASTPRIFKKHFGAGVPCRVVSDSITDAQLIQLSENMARQDNTAAEVVQHIERLVESGVGTKAIASAIGRSETYVRDYKRFISKACSVVRKALENGKISFDDGLTIVRKPEADQPAILKDLLAASELPKAEATAKKREAKAAVRKTTKSKATNATDADANEIRTVKELTAVSQAFASDAAKNRSSKAFTRSQISYMISRAFEFALGHIDFAELKVSNKNVIAEQQALVVK